MLNTIVGSIKPAEKPGHTVLNLAGRDIDGNWIGQQTVIASPRLRTPGVLGRTLNFMARDLEAQGVV